MKTPEEIKRGLRCQAAKGHVECFECAYCMGQFGDYDCDYECDQIDSDALALIEQLEAAVPKWISVKERMPEPYQHVIVHVRHTEKWRGKANPEDCWHVVEEDCWLGDGWDCNADEDIHEITHWMPMPEAPKEG